MTMSRIHSFTAISSLIIALLICTCSGQYTYYMPWSLVPTAPFTKDLTANCICDLIAFSCDPGCCCDPNCPAGVVAATKANGTCLPEGPPAQTLEYCIASNVVQKVRVSLSFELGNLCPV